jgi:glutamate N-acetyltransferase/amino-acid N-acetyltransferase
MSTNDMILFMANGVAANKKITLRSKGFKVFLQAVNFVLSYLAGEIVKDAEGATKIVTIEISNARNKLQAKKLAKAVSGSILLKAALNGNSANWGRILSSLGATGLVSSDQYLKVFVGPYLVFDKYSRYNKKNIVNYYLRKNKEIAIRIVLNQGDSQAKIFTCDLSQRYILLNRN